MDPKQFDTDPEYRSWITRCYLSLTNATLEETPYSTPNHWKVMSKETPPRVLAEGTDMKKVLVQAWHKIHAEDLLADTPAEDATSEFYQECKMTLQDFIESVEMGMFVDSDGSGEMGTDTHRGSVSISPSDIMKGFRLPEWVTHIYWYNK